MSSHPSPRQARHAGLALVLILALSALPATLQAAGPVAQLDGTALVATLRGGGYVLLFRHAITDRSEGDVDRRNLENCATQRNLSARGREQAVSIGEQLRRLGVPIGAVLASPYCRTLETARLAFGTVEPSNDLISDLSDDAPNARERLTAALHALLARPPEPGTNTVLVTHVLNIADAIGYEIEEGEALVASPDGAGGFSIIAHVAAEGWAELAAP